MVGADSVDGSEIADQAEQHQREVPFDHHSKQWHVEQHIGHADPCVRQKRDQHGAGGNRHHRSIERGIGVRRDLEIVDDMLIDPDEALIGHQTEHGQDDHQSEKMSLVLVGLLVEEDVARHEEQQQPHEKEVRQEHPAGRTCVASLVEGLKRVNGLLAHHLSRA